MKNIVFTLVVALMACNNQPQMNTKNHSQTGDYLFVGTYTKKEGHVDGKGKGIHVLKWNKAEYSLEPHMIIDGPTNPSFIAMHPSLPVVYAVVEIADSAPENIGLVQAYQYDLVKKTFKLLGETSSQGDAPCHISISNDEQYVFVANYVGGSVASFKIAPDGSISEALSSFVNEKTTPTTPRQEAGHAHMIAQVPGKSIVLSSDLGTDEIISFDLNKQGQLVKKQSIITKQYAGPRHFDFHPKLDVLYSLNELNPSISVIQMQDGLPAQIIQQLEIPITKDGDAVYSSAIHAHPNGEVAYAAIRGLNGSAQNEIVVCQTQKDGTLEIIQSISTEGLVPRDFTITPDGDFLIAGNQDSDELVIYEIDAATSKLQLKRKDQSLPTPVCFQWKVVD